MTLKELVSSESAFCLNTDDFDNKNIDLFENTPEEIRDLVIEMVERLNGSWRSDESDVVLQERFWELFPANSKDSRGVPLHGQVVLRYGAAFLRNNRRWLL